MSEKDFPQFTEFDVDKNGLVTFQEWQKYVELQKEMEAQKKDPGALRNDAYANLLDVIYDEDDSSVQAVTLFVDR